MYANKILKQKSNKFKLKIYQIKSEVHYNEIDIIKIDKN